MIPQTPVRDRIVVKAFLTNDDQISASIYFTPP